MQIIILFQYFQNYTVEILHYPLVLAPIMSDLCLMPEYSDFFPLLETDVPKLAQFQQELMRGEKSKIIETLGKNI